ncbi:MAG: DNA-protecting protein DprA [Candidatus Omnitrophica bacterium]|nr:DNA-protecting protein DprA [Candidatus Omnitrophota bacterium]
MINKGLLFLNMLGIEAKKIKKILSAFKDPNAIITPTASSLKKIPLLTTKDIEKITNKQAFFALERELELIKKHNIDVIDILNSDYPKLLREIAHPPIVLYLKGSRNILKDPQMGIVGSRTSTEYGISTAFKFAKELSDAGLVVTSGLARGIDTAAHKGALANKTIAVLGSGILNIYPPENRLLAQEISRNGAIISEFPLLTSPARENFPRRNRIISGLSIGLLVVEAAERSGALITANFALEQNRDVFAVPGKTNSSQSKGTNSLIKDGAKLVDSIEDILSELNINLAME